jgi:hypothetical protein
MGSSSVYRETRLADLQRASDEYEVAKQNYQRLVRVAVSEQDPVKRDEILRTIEAENQRLTRVVEGLLTAFSQTQEYMNSTDTPTIDLQAELDAYKQQLDAIHADQDKVVQLNTVLNTYSYQNDSDRQTYYGYIIAVLVMLVIVFILFVFSYVFGSGSITTSTPATLTGLDAPGKGLFEA